MDRPLLFRLGVLDASPYTTPNAKEGSMMLSELVSVVDNDHDRWEVYRASKAAVNTLTRSFAARHRGDPRAMLVVAPGCNARTPSRS
jgi:NAD(P)-dependent dehydrogenase (short-subunit alcohol dehydrogenase family)